MRVGLAVKNLIIFVSLFCMVYWFYIQTKAPRYTQLKSKPQEYMHNLRIINFDKQGKPKEAMHADYWEFNPQVGCSDLIKPHVTVYKPNGDIWYLKSNKAFAWHPTISEKVTKIDMQDNVVIERPAINQTTPIKMETLALEYLPDQEMISTKEFVRMQQPGLTISGYGLVGYLDRNWIELHDKITTIFTPS